jgi:hypothetical protein
MSSSLVSTQGLTGRMRRTIAPVQYIKLCAEFTEGAPACPVAARRPFNSAQDVDEELRARLDLRVASAPTLRIDAVVSRVTAFREDRRNYTEDNFCIWRWRRRASGRVALRLGKPRRGPCASSSDLPLALLTSLRV